MMLSYMVPVEEKPPVAPKGRLALDLRGGSPGSPEAPVRRVRTAISKDSSSSSFASDLTTSSTPTTHDKPKHKLLGNGTKHTTLKRVSFGSSKGSMVETLIYESPLQEEPETSSPPQETAFPYTPVDDDSERSKVRVSFYQGARPQCLSPPPAPLTDAADFTAYDNNMAENAMYNRQASTESGWDNPFRPDGDLSREADEIVSLIKGGKPFTRPLPAESPLAAHDEVDEKAHANNVHSVQSSPAAKVPSPVQQSTPKANGAKNGGGHVELARSPEPQQPEHVTIKKKPKCKCCVVQ